MKETGKKEGKEENRRGKKLATVLVVRPLE